MKTYKEFIDECISEDTIEEGRKKKKRLVSYKGGTYVNQFHNRFQKGKDLGPLAKK